jgi:hypothetical protein
MKIEVEERVFEVLEKLRNQATARRLSLGVYLEQFVEPITTPPGDSLDEFDRILDELATLGPVPGSLPADFSRSDIYADHD